MEMGAMSPSLNGNAAHVGGVPLPVGGFDGEESAQLTLPRLKPALRAGLSAPHHSRTQVPQRFLTRLRRGRLRLVRLSHGRVADSPSCGLDELHRPHVATGLPPMIPRGSRALCCGRRRSSMSSGPFPRFTKRARGTVTLRADLRPAEVSWTFVQPSWELRGGFTTAK